MYDAIGADAFGTTCFGWRTHVKSITQLSARLRTVPAKAIVPVLTSIAATMKTCATCGINVERPDFTDPRLVQLPPDLTHTEFRTTTPQTRGFGCTTCGREWDIHGDLVKDL